MVIFNLFENEIKFNKSFDIYNTYRKKYINDYLEIRKKAEEYIKACVDIDYLIKYLPELVNKGVFNVVEKSIGYLYENGVKTIDSNTFIEKYYYEYFNYNDYLNKLQEEYINITQTAKELSRYRELQKANRSRWQGGGFGVKGAIKGAVTASALNAGSDFLRGFGDVSKSISDNGKIKNMKKDLLKKYKEDPEILNAIYTCVLGCLEALMIELSKNGKIEFIKLNSNDALALYKNTISYEKDVNIIISNIVECIRLNPYNGIFYEKLYEIDYKNEDLNNLVMYLGLDNFSLCNQYKEKYRDIDIKKRTFMNKVYETIQECDKAKNYYDINVNKALKEIELFIDENKIKFPLKNKDDYQNCIYILNEVEEKYGWTPQGEIVRQIIDGIEEYESIETNAKEYEKMINSGEKINFDKYLDKDDKENEGAIGGVIFILILIFLTNKFMGDGIIKNIIVGFLSISFISGIILSISIFIKKKIILSKIKDDYDEYKKIR